MAFTSCLISHSFINCDGTPASGSLTFALSGRITNGTKTIIPAEVTANLDNLGNLSQALTANVDAATVPQNTTWLVTMRILGAEREEFSIVVPAAASADLGALLPQQPFGG